MGREDDDSRVENVICRTPARNAQNLELVKSEILEMVDRAVRSHSCIFSRFSAAYMCLKDSEFTSQVVSVDRLYHRQLLTRLPEIEDLERTWNCKIVFPSTEQASDEVTVTGPQWLVPKCIDEFLVIPTLQAFTCVFASRLLTLDHRAWFQTSTRWCSSGRLR